MEWSFFLYYVPKHFWNAVQYSAYLPLKQSDFHGFGGQCQGLQMVQRVKKNYS